MKRFIIVMVMSICLVFLGYGVVTQFGYRIIYSPQSSIAKGFYLFAPCDDKISKDELVYFEYEIDPIFPENIIKDYRHLVKFVTGTDGAKINVDGAVVTICENGDCTSMDRISGMPYVDLPVQIPTGKLYVSGTSASSFDSRYIGLINSDEVLGCGFKL